MTDDDSDPNLDAVNVPPMLHAYVESPADDHGTDWLRSELDAIGSTFSPIRQRRVEQLFTSTVECEVTFFDAACVDGAAG